MSKGPSLLGKTGTGLSRVPNRQGGALNKWDDQFKKGGLLKSDTGDRMWECEALEFFLAKGVNFTQGAS